MRRNRKLREHRERLLKERSTSVAARRRVAKQRVRKKPRPSPGDPPRATKKLLPGRRRRAKVSKVKQSMDYSGCPASKPGPIDFVGYENYKCGLQKPVRVGHILESIGLGGAQVMAMELINGLNKYYGDYCENPLLYVNWKAPKKQPLLFQSYGVGFSHAKKTEVQQWCKKNKIDVILQHRISQSQCLKPNIPAGTKYLIVNHTWNTLFRMRDFMHCDYYISVCKFLDLRAPFQKFIHDTRRLVILNGVENDYLPSIKAADLAGDFKTGRCHRLVASKFKPESLRFLAEKAEKQIPGLTHHLIGHNAEAKILSKKWPMLHCHGSIADRTKKMSILKALDAYYYETYGHEGASIAILESLACGVPVICKPLGGNAELVNNGVNGYLVGDRTEFLKSMTSMAKNAKHLKVLKQQTAADFDRRLHIRHTAAKYMQVFEKLVQK
jgi:glycosyltransferase involved in cell wall biosynthesis